MTRTSQQQTSNASRDRTPSDVRRTRNHLRVTEEPQQEIARRAYEIFIARGATDGHDLDDWLQAERELSLRRN